MANQGNGSGERVIPDDVNQSLQRIGAAITAARPKPKTPAEAPEQAIGADTIVEYAAALAERVTAAGRYAREHGAYIDEVSIAFAKQLQQEAEQYAASLLASERRKMDELQKIMGKTGQ